MTKHAPVTSEEVDRHIAGLRERWKSPLEYEGQRRDMALVAEIESLRAHLRAIRDQTHVWSRAGVVARAALS